MGFVEIIREIKTEIVLFPKISMLVQIIAEILSQLYLKMTWFLTLGTMAI